jgi:hypothetical protein
VHLPAAVVGIASLVVIGCSALLVVVVVVEVIAIVGPAVAASIVVGPLFNRSVHGKTSKKIQTNWYGNQ